jgi:acyl dehydratase
VDLTPGAELAPFVRTTDFPHWNRYAAVNDEFIPIHMDDAAGQEAGFPTAIGMGNLIWSYFHTLLRDWMAGAGRIEKIGARYSHPNLRGSTVTIRAKVIETTELAGEARVVLELLASDDADRQLVTGHATVVVRRPAP